MRMLRNAAVTIAVGAAFCGALVVPIAAGVWLLHTYQWLIMPLVVVCFIAMICAVGDIIAKDKGWLRVLPFAVLLLAGAAQARECETDCRVFADRTDCISYAWDDCAESEVWTYRYEACKRVCINGVCMTSNCPPPTTTTTTTTTLPLRIDPPQREGEVHVYVDGKDVVFRTSRDEVRLPANPDEWHVIRECRDRKRWDQDECHSACCDKGVCLCYECPQGPQYVYECRERRVPASPWSEWQAE